jgi:glucose-6-phosphate isomerase
MITLDLTNLFKIDISHSISKQDIVDQKVHLIQYLELIHTRQQGFYTVIDDTQMVKDIEQYATSVRGVFDHIVVLGIGGSSLGAICLRDALGHLFDADKKDRKYPRLHVMDNIDPSLILELEEVIEYSRTLFVVISKSGTTPEILSQFMYFKSKIEKHRLAVTEHMVFVTDPEEGFLHDIARAEGVRTFPVPPDVGGRFSVLTAVGLLPAALIGINIRKLLKGAQAMRDSFLSHSHTKNLPFQLATVQYLLEQKGKTMHVMMPYANKLFRVADWYRQLLAESIGKAVDRNGNTVHTGITPVNALGATDQHSQSQLYAEGPHDKLIMFLTVDTLAKKVPIPTMYKQDARTAFLHKVSFNELIAVEQRATADAYTEAERPNITIRLKQIDEETLGALFMLFEGATAFLGEYYGVNAFDQPGVERAKVLTKQYLLD